MMRDTIYRSLTLEANKKNGGGGKTDKNTSAGYLNAYIMSIFAKKPWKEGGRDF